MSSLTQVLVRFPTDTDDFERVVMNVNGDVQPIAMFASGQGVDEIFMTECRG
jgi:hypothetical protein